MCISFSTFCFGQQLTPEQYTQIDDYIEHLIERQGIPGMSLAIKKGDQIVYRKNFGYANLEHLVPVTDESVFRLYSLTKPVISVGVFQLIESGKVSLEDFASDYVNDLPKEWESVQIKHLLSHSSGLPDMSPIAAFQDLSEEQAKAKVFSQEVRFSPGSIYDYNQTGFWLLQKIIEKVTGKSVSAFILDNQFKKSQNTFFSSDSRDIIRNRVTPYFPFTKGTLMIDHSYLQGTYAHSKNGLNTTVDDFIEWDSSLKQDLFLEKEIKDLMWEEYPYTNSNRTFTYGWDKIIVNGQDSYGFSGSLCTAYRIYPDDELSIIFFSNGLSKWYNIDNIMNHISGLIDEKLIVAENLGFESVLRSSLENNYKAFIEEYRVIKVHPLLVNNNFETHLNDVGYFLLKALNKPSKAIEIFEFNTIEHPDSWNTYDSLAEAYAVVGYQTEAITNYEKAIKLNPDQAYKQSTKSKIQELAKKNPPSGSQND